MAKTWLSVTVELLGGGGQDLWPWPGRIFAVGPSHTFAQLAEAIDVAFARWDRAHLSMFTLADGRVVTDPELGGELAASPEAPFAEPLDIGTAKVARTVESGEMFQYTFDHGDDWTHCCVVADASIDPLEVLGARPPLPAPFWGATHEGTGSSPRICWRCCAMSRRPVVRCPSTSTRSSPCSIRTP